MSNVSMFHRACLIPDCMEIKEGIFEPMCLKHMIEAWRWVEAHPNFRPDVIARREHERRPLPKMMSVVYYARLRHGDIKIGRSERLRSRISTLRLDWPECVLAAEWGGHEVETRRHAQFAAERRSNPNGARIEDFIASDRLMTHIDQVRADHGDPVEMDRELNEENNRRSSRKAS